MRWKLMGSYVLLLLLVGGTLSVYLNHTLEKYLVAGIRENLLDEARLAALMVAKEVRETHIDAPVVAAAIGRKINARVTIITLTGVVVGDSEVRPADLGGLENHLQRPEVQEALKSGAGSSIRYSATLRTDMLYVAVPFESSQENRGVLRLALPLSAVGRTTASLHAILGVALTVAALFSLVLSYILSNVTSRTLRTMTVNALRIGRGDFSRRLPVTSRDELGDLARVMNDMTGRIEGQVERLAAEKNRLDAILRGMGEGVMVTDAAGVVTLVNPAFRTLFTIQEEVEGRPLIEITRHPSLHEAFRTVVETKGEQLGELTLPFSGETTVLTHWVPLLDQERLQGVVAVFHDISDLKHLETVRRDFVANVSHELRTPVTVIKGYAETLLAGTLANDPARAAAFLEKIHRHAERLTSLVGDLLVLSELESGAVPLRRAPLTIDGPVRHACVLLEEKARAKEIAIDRAGIDGAPPVLADRSRLEQVLVNLLDNAIKYTPEGGRITISARGEGEMVRVTVSDTGVGIPPKDLPRIFERFYRVDAARSREQGGTGLGLSIVKHIVQLHGGTVAVESVPEKGSTFSFSLRKA
jgi:two-component system phosphate regulon sensor histidine kinase PhoR